MGVRRILKCDCQLGEGPLVAGDTLFFADITGKRIHACKPDGSDWQHWESKNHISAFARTDTNHLLLASDTALELFDPATGGREELLPMEADNPVTRSNDGRADRQGGFWIGTMGLGAEKGAGSIYRYFRGELRLLRPEVTIPNAMCFSPDGKTAYFADTDVQKVFKWALDADGWPVGEPSIFHDRTDLEGAPDGAVIDSEGAMWLALWGGGKVVRISPEGEVIDEITLPASCVTCPAFTPDLHGLLITTASVGLTPVEKAAEPDAGCLFGADIKVAGIEEPIVRLA